MANYYLGVDVGSVSTNLVLIDDSKQVKKSIYLRTKGNPIETIKKGLQRLNKIIDNKEIKGAGTTGSGRKLAGVLLGADVVKNEITAQAVAAINCQSGVHTVIEIGGQDSKIIIIRNNVAVDFAMNTVCAAGTGSFLDQQARRLDLNIEDFGTLALKAKDPVRIAGRCSVFAESDMIHKQQLGYDKPEIVAGLCQALVRNYLNNVAKGKEIRSPVVFQGGVAANKGIKWAFSSELDCEIIVPSDHKVMGAIGAAILAREKIKQTGKKSYFKSFELSKFEHKTKSYICDGCENHCEIVNIYQEGKLIAHWGGRCEKRSVGIGVS
ncbi:MAG: acyl-CoA dehydratase activase [Halanaerobiales bacterium]